MILTYTSYSYLQMYLINSYSNKRFNSYSASTHREHGIHIEIVTALTVEYSLSVCLYNDLYAINSQCTLSLDSQHHPAIYWAKPMLWEHSILRDICVYSFWADHEGNHGCLVEKYVPILLILPNRWQDGAESLGMETTSCLCQYQAECLSAKMDLKFRLSDKMRSCRRHLKGHLRNIGFYVKICRQYFTHKKLRLKNAFLLIILEPFWSLEMTKYCKNES